MVTQSLTYEHYMSVALSLGRRGLGKTWPNPSVGCVIVNDGVVVGRGNTGDGGRPHAETQALAQAGNRAKGATVFVTLEPCSHEGQTGSCAKALIDAGVGHVVVAIKDDDPRVNGSGLLMLKSAGIKVTTGVLSEKAKYAHSGFLTKINESRPKVTLKLATSLDGRIATRSGDSQWITSEKSREIVHLQRSSHDAIMVGAGTVRKDNPRLTVRNIARAANPVRVLISNKINLPQDSKIFSSMNEILKTRLVDHKDNVNQNSTERNLIDNKIHLQESSIEEIKKDRKKLIQSSRKKIEEYEFKINENDSCIEKLTAKISILNDTLTQLKPMQKKLSKMDSISAGLMSKIKTLKEDQEFFHDIDNLSLIHI